MGDAPRTMLEALSIRGRYHVLDHRFLARPECLEVVTALPQSNAVIGSGRLVDCVQVLAIVLPETDRTDQVVAALWQCDEVAAWTQLPGRWISRLVPLELIRHLAQLIARTFVFLTHGRLPPKTQFTCRGGSQKGIKGGGRSSLFQGLCLRGS